ncbi:AprI/Inh family metalloprotease inhibitor [Bartonella jaculi]|uniref:Protease inhibitor Inh/omp19 family protein n=1 Tax=Bartonella jaculi TaxID=686226 RepID=A0ABP9MYQ9_9HYPH
MSFSKISFFVALSTVTLLGGCFTSRFDSNDSNNELEVFYPLQQIPTFEVISNSSSSYSSAPEAADDSIYEKGDSQSDGRMASLELPGNAIDLSPASIAGVWSLSVGGKVCRIATPQTKFGQGFRAGPLHCPGIVSQVNSWAVKGKRLYFYNKVGRVIIALYSSNVDRFEGRTLDDHPVVLSR